jgi:hypothetical protein
MGIELQALNLGFAVRLLSRDNNHQTVIETALSRLLNSFIDGAPKASWTYDRQIRDLLYRSG